MAANVVETESYPSTVQGPAGGDPRTAKSVRSMGSPLASRSRWLRARLEELTGVYVPASAVDDAADTFTSAAHPFSDDDPMRVVSVGGSIPGGLTLGAIVYAKVVDADTMQVKATTGAVAALDLTTAGSGAIYLVRQVDAAAALWSPSSAGAGGTLPAGSLREQLSYLRDNYGRKAANNVWSGANTFGGMLLQGMSLRNGNAALDVWRDTVTLADASATLDYTVDAYEIPDVTSNVVYTLPAALASGRIQKWFRRSANANAFNAVLKVGGTTIATFPGSNAGKSWAIVETEGGSSWRTAAWGGAATANT